MTNDHYNQPNSESTLDCFARSYPAAERNRRKYKYLTSARLEWEDLSHVELHTNFGISVSKPHTSSRRIEKMPDLPRNYLTDRAEPYPDYPEPPPPPPKGLESTFLAIFAVHQNTPRLTDQISFYSNIGLIIDRKPAKPGLSWHIAPCIMAVC